MDGYEPTNAGRRIQEFIDQLSNWYVRRSRRRFWRNEGDADKLSGYITLHTCLVTVAKLMAPLAPFVAEEMYLNLVCSVDPSAPDSIHLSDYPVADESLVDQPLMAATQLAMKVASMGRAARSKAGLKVRQPLANVLVKIRVSEEREYIDQVRPQVLEELNIKDIQVIEDDAPLVRQVLDEAGDQTETILSVENYSVSMEGGYMVAVDGDLSDALKEEGLAREVVHRIQGMRRSANFDVTDRIVTYYQGPSEFAGIMQGAFSDYIRNETLSNDLVDGAPSTESATESTKIEGMEITLAVHQA
jgi:isoleucyl-tRNA synthetase